MLSDALGTHYLYSEADTPRYTKFSKKQKRQLFLDTIFSVRYTLNKSSGFKNLKSIQIQLFAYLTFTATSGVENRFGK